MNYGEQNQMAIRGAGQVLVGNDMNPTLAENIAAKIKFHEQEIERLKQIQSRFPTSMLHMNLRDLREAMSF